MMAGGQGILAQLDRLLDTTKHRAASTILSSMKRNGLSSARGSREVLGSNRRLRIAIVDAIRGKSTE